jgi:FKBP-type peptidyl-prolyl cis-trans isomerase
MRIRLVIIIILLLALPFQWSCDKENPVEKQETVIEKYIEAKKRKNPALRLSKSGNVYYLYEPGDTTITISTGDSIYFYYLATLVTDTLRYFDTNDQASANALRLDMPSEKFEPVKVIAGNNNLLPGLSIGLNMVHPDDFGEIIFNSDMGYGDKGNGIVPPFSPLIFKIVIIKIIDN